MSIDYSAIPTPSYVFGNSQDIHSAILDALLQETTNPSLSNFTLANYSGTQNISTVHNFIPSCRD